MTDNFRIIDLFKETREEDGKKMGAASQVKRAPTTTPRDKKPVRLKTWREAGAYFKKHLIPVRYGPKGQPIYSGADIDALNVILPEEL